MAVLLVFVIAQRHIIRVFTFATLGFAASSMW